MDRPIEPCSVCGTLLSGVVIRSDDRTVVMRSCSPCDRRWWTADGRPVAQPTELFRVAARR